MAVDYASNVSWHEGEREMQSLLHVPEQENPTSCGLAPYAIRILHRSHLLAIGILDDDGRPWTTLLGGQPGFARYLGQSSIVGVDTVADRKFDPVLSILTGDQHVGEVTRDGSDSRIMAGLAVRLDSRDRVKLSGRIVAGSFGHMWSGGGKENAEGHAQLVMKIEQSLGKSKIDQKDELLSL